MFVLFNFLMNICVGFTIGFVFGLVDKVEKAFVIINSYDILFICAATIPSLAVTVRRLHDTGRSGWSLLLLLIPIVGAITILVFLCADSQPSKNEFGNNPKKSASMKGRRVRHEK